MNARWLPPVAIGLLSAGQPICLSAQSPPHPSHATPLFSGDGKWLLYSWRGPEPDSLKKDSWRTRVSPSAITRGPDPKRFDGRVYTSLPFLEDERGLVPPRETRRPSHLYLVPRGGGEPKQLTSGDLSQRAPDWSPAGRAIVLLQDSTDTSEVRH